MKSGSSRTDTRPSRRDGEGDHRRAEGCKVIGLLGAVRVLVATRPVDFRKGAEGLVALVRDVMGADPFDGAVYVFRAKRADRVKLVFWEPVAARDVADPRAVLDALRDDRRLLLRRPAAPSSSAGEDLEPPNRTRVVGLVITL